MYTGAAGLERLIRVASSSESDGSESGLAYGVRSGDDGELSESSVIEMILDVVGCLGAAFSFFAELLGFMID